MVGEKVSGLASSLASHRASLRPFPFLSFDIMLGLQETHDFQCNVFMERTGRTGWRVIHDEENGDKVR